MSAFCHFDPTDEHNGHPEFFFNSEQELRNFFASNRPVSHPPINHEGKFFGGKLDDMEERYADMPLHRWHQVKKQLADCEMFHHHRLYQKSQMAIARLNYDVPNRRVAFERGEEHIARMVSLRPRRNGKAHLPNKYFYTHATRTSPSLAEYQ